jgi:hypothetical protein
MSYEILLGDFNAKKKKKPTTENGNLEEIMNDKWIE